MNPNKHYVFDCVDAYTAGNPVRLIKSPKPDLKGITMGEKRIHFIKNFDWIRTGLMFEPHGHDMMSGSFFYPPQNSKNDIAILFIETSGCLPMCGHGLIGTLTILMEEGLIDPQNEGEIRVETPAGLVIANYKKKEGKILGIKFVNVPSFLAATDLKIFCSDLGELKIDVSYGGNFYAIIDIQKNFNGINEYSAGDLIKWSREIRDKINSKNNFIHPTDNNIKGCSHILWGGQPFNENSTASNAVFYGDKAIDRSPCGTGTCARMAQWFAKGKLNVNETFVHESIIGSKFIGRVEEETKVGNLKAIIPSIEGDARIIGYNQLILDPEDPYVKGFQVI